MRRVIFVKIKSVFAQFQPVVMTSKIKGWRISIGEINSNPMPFSEQITRGPNLNLVFVDLPWFYGTGILVGIIGLIRF
jgi:hypothetical protein